MRRSRTGYEMPVKLLISLEEPHSYQLIGQEAKRLRQEGLSYVQIGKRLGVTDKTAKKAIEK